MICKHEKCGIMASFNYKGEDQRIYCSTHKLDGMVNVRYKFCAHGTCLKRKINGEKTCKEHGIGNMTIKKCASILLSIKLHCKNIE